MAKGKNVKVSTKTVGSVVAGKVAHASAISPPAVAARATTDDVARRAYAIYEQEGRPDGRQVEHWVRAERELGLA
jgi:hypothetical protein